MNFYEVLGVEKTANAQQLRLAFQERARVHNPRTGGNPKVRAVIDRAYIVLSNERKRLAYDTFLSQIATNPVASQPKNQPENQRDKLRQAAQRSLFDLD